MQGNPDIDVLMIPTSKAIKKYVKDRDAFTEIYNRAYEAVVISMEAKDAELEAENEKINYFFRKLRMFCIFAHWDNPNTEAEFYKVDAEIREYLSEYKVCID